MAKEISSFVLFMRERPDLFYPASDVRKKKMVMIERTFFVPIYYIWSEKIYFRRLPWLP